MSRLPASLAVALTGALLLWLALGINTVLVIGYEFAYLNDGRFPLYPTVPVTYLSLSLLSLPIVLLFALITTVITFVARNWPIWPLLALLWLGAAWIAAGFIAFEFQIDFGATWTTSEAIRSFFYRPYITLPLALIGVATFIWATRRILRPRKNSLF